MSLKQWCKYAGPIGPVLWAFDGLVNMLAGSPEPTRKRRTKEQVVEDERRLDELSKSMEAMAEFQLYQMVKQYEKEQAARANNTVHQNLHQV